MNEGAFGSGSLGGPVSRADEFPRIEDLAIIGNTRTAALVSVDGAVEWFCVPRFDSPSVFGRLLDRDTGGCFRVAPAHPEYDVRRRYLPDTVVLETTFTTPEGCLRLTDAMPVADERERTREPWPEHEILRKVECVDGEVEISVDFRPRPDYGRVCPKVEDRGPLGIWCQNDAEALTLLADVPLEAARHRAHGREILRAGDVRWISLAYARGEPSVLRDPARTGPRMLDLTAEWWRGWASRCRYEGPYEEAVRRSALTLKLLTYSPSGAVVAAPTTSLPEVVGGVRNWDYRYCWLRDASWTLRALFELGYLEEAKAFFDWTLHATRLTHPELQVVYDVTGEARLQERSLDHLSGYRGSRPVRVGNGAHDQLQLDVYGEVIGAALEYLEHGGEMSEEEIRFIVDLGSAVADRWDEPDAGIWELRGGPRHNTHSKVMCWAALDWLLELHEERGIEMPDERFRRERRAIREAVESRAVAPEHDCYMRDFDAEVTDAALLRLPAVGYADATDDRMRRTIEHVLADLGADGGLIYRYPSDADTLPGEEGAFALCSFWAVEAEALAGDLEAAERRFDTLLGYANDVGLYAEEIDAATGCALGNFPQAFTHIGLINAALTLQARREGGAGARIVAGHLAHDRTTE